MAKGNLMAMSKEGNLFFMTVSPIKARAAQLTKLVGVGSLSHLVMERWATRRIAKHYQHEPMCPSGELETIDWS